MNTKDQLIGKWSGSVTTALEQKKNFEKWQKSRRELIKWLVGIFLLGIVATFVKGTMIHTFLWTAFFLVVMIFSLLNHYSGKPEWAHYDRYLKQSERLAKALGESPDYIRQIDYVYLKKTLVLPRLTGLLAEAKEQVMSGMYGEAYERYNELHMSCTPFDLRDGRHISYTSATEFANEVREMEDAR